MGEVQNEDKSDKRTIFRYRKLYDTFLFISILLLFINYFTVKCELEELRKNIMIPRPKGQKGLHNSQGEVEEPGPRGYLGSGGERGEKVDEGDNCTIGQVEHKIPTTGQTIHKGDKYFEGDKGEPEQNGRQSDSSLDVITSSPSNTTDQGCKSKFCS